MEILDCEDHADSISWLSHGRGFSIANRATFEVDVLPRYFNKQSKFSSFSRRLNRWGFVRVHAGPESGAYYHPCFKRGDHRLLQQMSCQIIRKQSNKSARVLKPAPRGELRIDREDFPVPSALLETDTNELNDVYLEQFATQMRIRNRNLMEQEMAIRRVNLMTQQDAMFLQMISNSHSMVSSQPRGLWGAATQPIDRYFNVYPLLPQVYPSMRDDSNDGSTRYIPRGAYDRRFDSQDGV
jgi:HSF-type DNA-binding